MTFRAGFKGTGSSLAWVKDQAGTILYLKDTSADTASFVKNNIAMPAGTSDLEAGTTENMPRTTNTRSSGGDVYRLSPSDAACTSYTIYAKVATEDDKALAFGFDKTLKFVATSDDLGDGTTFYSYISCNKGTLYYGLVDVTTLPVKNDIGTPEKMVGYPACNGTHAEGTSFDLDGRNCTCVKGDAFCDAPPVGSYFRMSDREAVGVALSVSVIVLLVLMALIFLCLKKTAQKQELVGVLKSNTKGSVPQDDRL